MNVGTGTTVVAVYIFGGRSAYAEGAIWIEPSPTPTIATIVSTKIVDRSDCFFIVKFEQINLF